MDDVTRKVLGETWVTDGTDGGKLCTYEAMKDGDVIQERFGYFGDFDGVAAPVRARLAARAPEMARMLLRLEAPCPGSYLCAICGKNIENEVPHKPTCAWLVLMKKAGLR